MIICHQWNIQEKLPDIATTPPLPGWDPCRAKGLWGHLLSPILFSHGFTFFQIKSFVSRNSIVTLLMAMLKVQKVFCGAYACIVHEVKVLACTGISSTSSNFILTSCTVQDSASQPSLQHIATKFSDRSVVRGKKCWKFVLKCWRPQQMLSNKCSLPKATWLIEVSPAPSADLGCRPEFHLQCDSSLSGRSATRHWNLRLVLSAHLGCRRWTPQMSR
jgi:hypothetical protein